MRGEGFVKARLVAVAVAFICHVASTLHSFYDGVSLVL